MIFSIRPLRSSICGNLRRLRTIFPFLASTAFLLPGCTRPHAAGRVAQGNHDQIFHWGNGADPGDLDPQTEEAETSSHVFNALFEGLVSQDPQDLHPIPGVAASWDVSPDARVYTFHLRSDAKWSNGDPVTAHDFIASWQRLLSPALGSQYAQMLYQDAEVVNARAFYDGKLTDFNQVGLQAPDDHTLVVHLVNPTDYFLSMLNHESLYPVHVPTILKYGRFDRKGTAWTRPGHFVGNGPFALKSWRLRQEIVVERSPTYWDAKNVRLEEIHYYPTDNIDTEERDFRAGQLHVTYELPLTKIDYYEKNHPAVFQNSPYFGTYFLRLNLTRPALGDKRVRRALSLAIDREGIARTVARGGQRPAYFFTPPDANGYTSRARVPTDYDAARRLLAGAGHPDGQGLPPVEILINTSQNHQAVAEVVQQTWREQLHVNATIRVEESKVWFDSMHTLNYEVCRAGWIGDYVDPFSFLGIFVTGGGNNDCGFANGQYDDLIARSRTSASAPERRELLQQAEAILLDEAPVAPIFFYARVYLKQTSVKGWYPNVLDRHMPKFIYLEESAPNGSKEETADAVR